MEEVEEVSSLMKQMADARNRLKQMGVISSEEKITEGYAEWFCAKLLDLELCTNRGQIGYDAISQYDERVQIKSRTGSDIDFSITFDGIHLGTFDYLLAVFIDEATWMITSIYKVPHNIMEEFMSSDSARSFRWCRKSRALSMKIYPPNGDYPLIID